MIRCPGAVRLIAGLVFVALTALFTPCSAQEVKAQSLPRTGGNAVLNRVKVSINKSQTLRLDYPFTDILVGSSDIAEVIPLSDRTLYVLGKKAGTTNVSVLDSTKRLLGVIDVEVGLDAPNVAAKVVQATGTRGIQVQGYGDQVVLSGEAEDAPTVDRAVKVASALVPGGVINTTRVRSPQQVMLKVRFVEVNRTVGRDIGFRWEWTGRSSAGRVGAVKGGEFVSTTLPGAQPGRGVGLFTDVLPTVAGLPVSAAAAASPIGTGQFAQIVTRLISTNSTQLDLFISALEEQGLARRLAEPTLISMSGEQADFLAGGEYPIPISSTTGTGAPTITIAYKEFGVRLNFTPTVLSGGQIHLRLEPEVSDIDPAISINTAGVTVPGLSKRKARTNIELRDGQSFAIAGLLQAISERNLEQLPWLSSIPVIGALFRSSEFRKRNTELVVIVTPFLVKPAKPGQLLGTPLDTRQPSNDLDYFINGNMDVQKASAPGATPLQDYIAVNGQALGPYGHMLPPYESTR